MELGKRLGLRLLGIVSEEKSRSFEFERYFLIVNKIVTCFFQRVLFIDHTYYTPYTFLNKVI